MDLADVADVAEVGVGVGEGEGKWVIVPGFGPMLVAEFGE